MIACPLPSADKNWEELVEAIGTIPAYQVFINNNYRVPDPETVAVPEDFDKAEERPHPTVQVISGGQTGPEQIALREAKRIGLGTGGFAPLGYKTEEGNNASLKDIYGVKEHNTTSYPERTRRNVEVSDGTVIFGKPTNPATKKAIDSAEELEKPYLLNPTTAEELTAFLNEKNIGTLNVAGDSASRMSDADLRNATAVLSGALHVPQVNVQRDINIYDETQDLSAQEIITKLENVNESIKSPTYDKADKFKTRYRQINSKTGLEEIIKNRVTDKQQKLFEKLAGGKKKAEEINEKYTNRIKRENGIALHAEAENMLRSFLGLEEEVTKSILKDTDRAILKNGVSNIGRLIQEHQRKIDPNGTAKVLTENTIYDPKKDTAGSIDVLVVYSDGSVSIYDWKFINFKRNRQGIVTGVSENKMDSWDSQISEYKRILSEQYGIRKFRESRIIPVDVQYEWTKGLDGKSVMSDKIKSISIGVMQSEHLANIPVGFEMTDDDNINNVLDSLMSLLSKAKQIKKGAYDKEKANARIYELRKAIKKIQREKDIDSALFEVKHYTDEMARTLAIQDLESPEYVTDLATVVHTLNVYKNLLKSATKYGSELEEEAKEEGKEEEGPTRKEALMDKISQASSAIAMLELSLDDVILDRVKQVADENNIKGIEIAQKETSATSSMFNHLSSWSHPVFQAFKKLIDKSHNNTKRELDALDKELREKADAIEKWGRANGYKGSAVYDILVNKEFGSIVSKQSNEFYQARAEAIDSANTKWLKDNYRKTEEGKKVFEAERKRIYDAIDRNYKRDAGYAAKLKAKWKTDNDLWTSNTAWLNTRALAKYAEVIDKPEWKNANYKIIESTPELKAYYDFYVNHMNTLMQIVPADRRKSGNFIPNIQKDIIDTVAETGLTAFKSMGQSFINSLEHREDDSLYGMTDPITGKPEKRVPIMFMAPITDNQGDIDVSQKSTDLSKSLRLFSESVYNYKHTKQIEDTVQTMREYLASKDQVVTDKANKPIRDLLGKAATAMGSSDTLGSFDKFMNYYIYGERLQSKDVTVKMGDKTLSGQKLLLKTMSYFSTKSLAFNLFSAGANAVGAMSNAYMQGVKGKFYSTAQMRETIKDLSNFSEKGKTAAAFSAYFEADQTDHNFRKANNLSANKLTKWLTVDNMMILQRKTDDFVDKTVTISMGKQYGIDENGQIKNLSKLPEGTKSLMDLATLTDEGLKIEGLTEKEFDKFRAMVMYVSGTIKGTTTDEDINLVQTTLLGRMLMQYRSWLPRMAEERFRKTSYNHTVEEVEMGRFRVGFGEVFHEGLLPTVKRFSELMLGAGIGWTGIYTFAPKEATNNKLFNNFISENPEFLANFSSVAEAREAFAAERAGQLKALAAEIRMYMLVVAALTAMGLDWDDDEQPEYKDYAFTRVLYQLSRRSALELGFFLNPKEATQLVKKPIALVGLLEQIGSLISNTTDESRDFIFGEESFGQKKYRDKTDKGHYSAKMVPLLNSFSNIYGAIVDGMEKD